MARRITCTASIWGLDHESFAPNEEASRTVTSSVVIDAVEQPQDLIRSELRWGGECRIELVVIAVLLESGRVTLKCTGKLFEGDSESTMDLEHEQHVELLLPRGQGRSAHIALESTGTGGGDRGTIDLSATNSLVEDE